MSASPLEDASRLGNWRVVRSVRSDRHRRIGFDGPLTAFSFHLAHRVFLDRHWSSPCAEHGDLLPNVRTPCRALPRFLAAVRIEPTRLVELDATPSKDLAPSAFSAREANCRRDCQPPASVGVSGVSHPLHALTAPRAFRACFIPDTLVGFHPSGLSFLCGAVSPFGALCPLGVWLEPLAPNRSPVCRGDECHVDRSPVPFSTGDQAPMNAGPDRAYNASIMRPTPTVPRGTVPFKLKGASPSSLWYRTLNDFSAVFRAFLSAKNSVPSAGCYTVSEAVALLGLSSSGRSHAAPGVDLSKSPSPRELHRPRPQPKLRMSRRLLRVSASATSGRSSCEARRPS